jgi:mannose/fructose/N-acetylgalactosamine-specific phosphotransferase system component IID
MDFDEIIKGFFALIFLQSSWSYVGRQTLGFLYAIILLTKNRTASEPTRAQIKGQIWQKLSLNTNPYCTGVMIGIAINKQGEIFKESYFSLQYIFGSIGDEFFWQLLRPTLLGIAVLLSLIGYILSNNQTSIGMFRFSSLLFLIPYIFITQGTRIRGLYQGEKYGKDAAIFLIKNLRKKIPKLYKVLSFIIGVLLVIIPIVFLSSFGGYLKASILATLLIFFIILISYLALRSERSSSYLLIAGLLILLIIKLL